MQGIHKASILPLAWNFFIKMISFTICSGAGGIRDWWVSFGNGKVLNTIVRNASHFLEA